MLNSAYFELFSCKNRFRYCRERARPKIAKTIASFATFANFAKGATKLNREVSFAALQANHAALQADYAALQAALLRTE